MLILEQHWYRSSLSWLSFLLLPVSWLFSLSVAARHFLYRYKIKKTYAFPVPIIIVGNITVGGTGKTPFAIWLVDFLRKEGYRPGIVSRGIGGKKIISARWVDAESSPEDVGDEAVLLVKRANVPLVIGVDRVAATKELLIKTECNIVISDDGLQHYRLARDIEIAIIDGARGLGNKQLLPAGPLRELSKRLQEVDLVITQTRENKPSTFYLEGEHFVALTDENKKMPYGEFKYHRVHAVVAIGNPQRFFNALRAADIEVIEHVFPDHYLFTEKDILFPDGLPVIMTEKDAVKCHAFAKENMWYWPVEAKVSDDIQHTLRRLLCAN